MIWPPKSCLIFAVRISSVISEIAVIRSTKMFNTKFTQNFVIALRPNSNFTQKFVALKIFSLEFYTKYWWFCTKFSWLPELLIQTHTKILWLHEFSIWIYAKKNFTARIFGRNYTQKFGRYTNYQIKFCSKICYRRNF